MILETLCYLCNQEVFVLITPSGQFVTVNPYEATLPDAKPVPHTLTCPECVRGSTEFSQEKR